ncbi:MAG: hypothetical protein NTZ74_01975 [Chloroflexi bacterium]|nr:hypothetical protein [Chloroflexota bacterium]
MDLENKAGRDPLMEGGRAGTPFFGLSGDALEKGAGGPICRTGRDPPTLRQGKDKTNSHSSPKKTHGKCQKGAQRTAKFASPLVSSHPSFACWLIFCPSQSPRDLSRFPKKPMGL